MLKKVFKIGMFASVLAFACNAVAQDNEYPRVGFWSNWSIGAGVVGNYENARPFEWRKGLDMGFTVFAEKELNHVWAVRLAGGSPGVIYGLRGYEQPVRYDRYGKATVDFKFSINNAIKGYDPDRKGSLYLLAGGGLGFMRWNDYGRGSTGEVQLAAEAGLGYSHKVCEHSTLYVEVQQDMINEASNFFKGNWSGMSTSIILGYMYNFGLTSYDQDMIAARQRLTPEQYALMEQERDDWKAKYDESQRVVSKLSTKVQELRDSINDLSNGRRNDALADSLQRIIDNYTNNKECYALPFSILYGIDKYTVTNDQMKKVKAIADIMNKDKDAKFEIVGYCDYSGSDEYNQKLSEKRAENVKKLLVDKYGIDEDRLTTSGKGKSKPFGDEKNAVNRRVSFYRVND